MTAQSVSFSNSESTEKRTIPQRRVRLDKSNIFPRATLRQTTLPGQKVKGNRTDDRTLESFRRWKQGRKFCETLRFKRGDLNVARANCLSDSKSYLLFLFRETSAATTIRKTVTKSLFFSSPGTPNNGASNTYFQK